MRLLSFRVGLFALMFVSASFALADQKIKTKSNIKNDRLAETSSSSAACEEQKEGSADQKVDCKTTASKSSTSSAPSKEADTPKP